MAGLIDAFEKWGTDKGQCSTGPTGNAEWHGYAGFYECLFHRYRCDVKAVLELGIGTLLPEAHSSFLGYAAPGYRPGGSLRAWRDYFENATIYGLDVQPDTQFADEDRIITRLCDSTNAAQVGDVLRGSEFPSPCEFDLIIDDASHLIENQINTLKNFYPYVKANGFYIIEDVTDYRALVDPVKAVIGNAPFLFKGANNNLLVILKRRAEEAAYVASTAAADSQRGVEIEIGGAVIRAAPGVDWRFLRDVLRAAGAAMRSS
jgi:hypothetical protein